MIEVGCFIKQLYVGETQEKNYNGNPVLIPYCNTKSRQATNKKQQIGVVPQ